MGKGKSENRKREELKERGGKDSQNEQPKFQSVKQKAAYHLRKIIICILIKTKKFQTKKKNHFVESITITQDAYQGLQ